MFCFGDLVTELFGHLPYTKNNKTQTTRKGDIHMSVLHLTKETFANEVLHTSLPVLIDFMGPVVRPSAWSSPVDQLLQE